MPDTQKAFDHLFDTCYEAGSRCALYKSADTSPIDIRQRLEAFMDELDTSPAPYLSHNMVTSIGRQDVLATVFSPLYQPQRAFPGLATTLAEAMNGNFTRMYDGLGAPKAQDSCTLRTPATYTWDKDAQAAIACGDGESQVDLGIEAFLDHLDRLKADSPDFGAGWASIRVACTGWGFRPKYRFSGPWTTPEADPGDVEGRPSAPLLFVSSRIDPVTPLANAYAMSKDHPGSRVLVQENVGHGSLFSPGKCREDYIKTYFATGELPPEGTVCAPDCKPFQECPQMLRISAVGLDGASDWEARRRAPLALI